MLSVLPFIPNTVVRALVACLLSFISIILYRETCPFHLDRNNVLGVSAQFQVFGTCVAAFIVLADAFPYGDTALGLSLVLLNIGVVPLIMYTSRKALEKQAEMKRHVAKLHTQLLKDSEEDEANYQKAWNKLRADNEDAATSVLSGTKELAMMYKDNGRAGQVTTFRSIDELHDGPFAHSGYIAATY